MKKAWHRAYKGKRCFFIDGRVFFTIESFRGKIQEDEKRSGDDFRF